MGDWALPEEKPVLLARVVPSISNSIGAGLRLLWEEYTGPWSLEDMSLHRAPKQNKTNLKPKKLGSPTILKILENFYEAKNHVFWA